MTLSAGTTVISPWSGWSWRFDREAPSIMPGVLWVNAPTARSVSEIRVVGSAMGPPHGRGGDPIVGLPAFAGRLLIVEDTTDDAARITWAIYRIEKVTQELGATTFHVSFADVQRDPFQGSAQRIVHCTFT